MKMDRACALALLLTATPALAADPSLSITKSFAVVGDPLALVQPRMLPGVTIDYTLTVTNPVTDVTVVVLGVPVLSTPFTFGPPRIEDQIPPTVVLRVTSIAGSGAGGPVEFMDGGLLGLGGSGLSYTFTSLASATDGLEFSDGKSWSYVPQPDGEGYDPKVRGIRVTPTGTKLRSAGSFRLRYRVRLR